MKDIAKSVIEKLKNDGAQFADVRIHLQDETESISTMNATINNYNYDSRQGYGIRVLFNGAWGFSSSEEMTIEAMTKTASEAIEKAQTASTCIVDKIELAPKKVYQANYSTPNKIDPFTVETKDKITRLMTLDKKLGHDKFDYWGVSAYFNKREIYYIDTEGTETTRNLMEVEGSYFAMAKDNEGHQQRRTYGMWQDANGTQGWENFINDEQFDQTKRIQEELLLIIDAKKCEKEVCDVILLPEMMALQTHETIGHALELDRILGYELSYAGGSHIDLEHFGSLQFGSSKLTARADGTVKNSTGSIGFDDDGVKAENIVMIENGLLKDAITSRQMIVEANKKAGRTIFKKSGATCRAQSYSNLPIERMNNINIDAGQDGSLEDIIANTKNGILLETPRSWSIGSNRENFHFACEIGWKIIDGKISHVVKNPTYRGDSLKFWHSLDMVGDESTWQLQPTFNCGKGQPNQIMRLGHGIPVCRFNNVEVGN